MRRRSFLKMSLGGAIGAVALRPNSAAAWQSRAPADSYAALVDLTRCIGCRKCEQACQQEHDLPLPMKSFEDLTVLDNQRRPDAARFTVINRYHSGRVNPEGQLVADYVKVQCMHCQDPACASACITGALSKTAHGAVHYDVNKCIGCRYCMVACPFEIPAYEYHDPLTPRVMKCTFCEQRLREKQLPPACATICPTEAITFGKRSALLKLARRRLKEHPGRYIQQIYGENEVGGTSWLYLSAVPFSKLGFIPLPNKPLPKLTETLQHSLFSYLWSPALLFTLLSGLFFFNRRKQLQQPENSAGHAGGDV
ncbi:MAG: 4Fe-4S dicluster domain-containing protein [Desulfuromonadaceae bacterium]|nr:4Fe-4S dicluster domain-containing protein [Desulfuromonadaceae bacterium]